MERGADKGLSWLLKRNNKAVRDRKAKTGKLIKRFTLVESRLTNPSSTCCTYLYKLLISLAIQVFKEINFLSIDPRSPCEIIPSRIPRTNGGYGTIQSPGLDFRTKLDGYRAIAVIDSTGRARIWSGSHLPLGPKVPTIQDAVNQLRLRSTILDGEIVALDNGRTPPVSNCCNSGRSDRLLRLLTFCPICFGTLA